MGKKSIFENVQINLGQVAESVKGILAEAEQELDADERREKVEAIKMQLAEIRTMERNLKFSKEQLVRVLHSWGEEE
jgi:ADP-ribose pyrophosphatase YjhB (NUDIX family)